LSVKPVTPRHAASLVIYRELSSNEGPGKKPGKNPTENPGKGPGERPGERPGKRAGTGQNKERDLEVLMGCRHSKARFQPGVYVFPGGMLERSDFNVTPADSFDQRFVRSMGVGGSLARAQALAVAAVRETYEEVGLFVAKKTAAAASSNPAWQDFATQNLAPRLSPMAYIGRAITPARQPIRFDARFFCIEEKYTTGNIRDNGELTDLRWIKLSRRDDFNMMKVTHLMMDMLQAKVRDVNAKVPFLYFINGQKVLKWS
jgi:8-oxo-dGTP pyrophosphatase MutT (NUDIX family)